MKLINPLKTDIHLHYIQIFITYHYKRMEHAVVRWVEALRYKPEGRGFDSR